LRSLDVDFEGNNSRLDADSFSVCFTYTNSLKT
jgi:hypothetical protein